MSNIINCRLIKAQRLLQWTGEEGSCYKAGSGYLRELQGQPVRRMPAFSRLIFFCLYKVPRAIL